MLLATIDSIGPDAVFSDFWQSFWQERREEILDLGGYTYLLTVDESGIWQTYYNMSYARITKTPNRHIDVLDAILHYDGEFMRPLDYDTAITKELDTILQLH